MAVTDAGVLAWCDTIRYTVAKDPGREVFETQIMQHGFDFLENYVEDVLSRQATEPVYELLKTPGKKKDGPKRTAATVAAKLRAVNSTIFEEREQESEDSVSTNAFQQALIAAKDNDNSRHQDTTKELSLMHESTANIAITADVSPAADMEVDEVQQLPVFQRYGTKNAEVGLVPPVASEASVTPQDIVLEAKSTSPIPSEPDIIPVAATPEVQELTLVAQRIEKPEAEVEAEAEAPIEELVPVVPTENITELSMIAEDDEINEQPISTTRTATSTPPVAFPQSLEYNMDQDVPIPIKDGSGTSSLKRKQTMSVPGLSAPSPLRKSMRMSREPALASNPLAPLSLAQTPGTGLGGKRTSWLSKAKEAKALELTVPRKRVTSSAESTTSFSSLASMTFAGSAGSLKNIFQQEPVEGVDALDVISSRDTNQTIADLDVVMEVDQSEGSSSKDEEPARMIPTDDFTGRIVPTVQQQVEAAVVPKPSTPVFQPTPYHTAEDMAVLLADEPSETQALDRLKKTVEDVGRTARTFGKSLGGNAAAALAEARAAAEARVAQRNKAESGDISVVEVESSLPVAQAVPDPASPETAVADAPVKGPPVDVVPESDRRFSLSELVSTSTPKIPESSSTADLATASLQKENANASTSTTPPNSPPSISAKPSKPAPEFKPSAASTGFSANAPSANPEPVSQDALPAVIKNFAFKLPAANPFSLPIPQSLGLAAVHSSLSNPKPVPAQSSKASVFSDGIFDKEGKQRPSMPLTQGTEYTTAHSNLPAERDELDDDDSWHMDEKFRSNEAWTPYGFVSNEKEDNTWSTLPSRSDGDTGPAQASKAFSDALQLAASEDAKTRGKSQDQQDDVVKDPFDFDADMEKAHVDVNDVDGDVDMELDGDEDEDERQEVDSELEDILATGKATITLVQKGGPPRSQSQMSIASTSSSQSNAGFLGQATRFMSSVLGASKSKGKGDPPKSLARAAAMAKKQQEEADKKAARLKEMENRRQLALQRKAEEEKARAEDEERKIREENEKRKREREEHTGKFSVKLSKKNEDDTMGKRKLAAEMQKKPEAKKPPSKDAQANRSLKPPSSSINAPTTATKGAATVKALSKQPTTVASSSNLKAAVNDAISVKPGASSSTLKSAMKGKAKAFDDAQPSQVLQNQMADRAKVQVQAAQTPREPPVASESIELPDVNSEYSDSEDEDRPRTFDRPEWARTPELHQQLHEQSRWNPDDIFGRIGPLRMEEIFRTRQSRFRARTSSANWAGADQLTEQEEREYARRMGFTK